MKEKLNAALKGTQLEQRIAMRKWQKIAKQCKPLVRK